MTIFCRCGKRLGARAQDGAVLVVRGGYVIAVRGGDVTLSCRCGRSYRLVDKGKAEAAQSA